MITINQPYTLGKWIAKAGCEEAFIAEWTSLAKWTAMNQGGAGIGYLLQDPQQPQYFISFGAWQTVEAIKEWRDRSEFKAFVVKAKELCEDFQPHLLTLVASSE